MKLSSKTIENIVLMALTEDAPSGDLTSQALIPASARIAAQLVAREEGVLSGEDFFSAAMALADAAVKAEFFVHDGERFAKGAVLATVDGAAQPILRAERVALNFVQRMSGVATLTAG